MVLHLRLTCLLFPRYCLLAYTRIKTFFQVHINSPKIIDGIVKPYLVLETKDMSATVTMETWILNASAKLGAIELLDHLNTGNLILA